jgi:hypothetical protein
MDSFNTIIVNTPTYVSHDDLGFIYSGDKLHRDDYDVTSKMHPFDGNSYRYVPETESWELNLDSVWVKVREERNKKIDAFRWKVDRQRDLIDLGLAEAATLTPLLQYVQALRDIPQTFTDPFAVVFPDEPDYLSNED